jgi:hypothetical protein
MTDYLEAQDRQSLTFQSNVRLDFVLRPSGPFVFNADYTAVNVLHQRYGTDNDTLAHSFTVAPGVSFERFAVNLAANYTHTLKRDPGYRRYSESSSIGPLFRYLLSKDNIIEVSSAFVRKNFFRSSDDPENEAQSSYGMDSFVSWNWFFRDNAFLNVKFGYAKENAEGRNYDSQGYRCSANLIYPLLEKLRLQLGASANFQDYKNENIIFDNTVRKDRIYIAMVGLTWPLFKQLDVIAQYMYSRTYSNIYLYDYKRDIYSLGMELKF